MTKNIVVVLGFSVLLSGCGWFDGRNTEEARGVHEVRRQQGQSEVIVVQEQQTQPPPEPIEVKDIRAVVEVDEEWLKSHLTQDMFELDHKLQSSKLVAYNGENGVLTIRTVSGVTIQTQTPIKLTLTADHDMVFRDGNWEVTDSKVVSLTPQQN